MSKDNIFLNVLSISNDDPSVIDDILDKFVKDAESNEYLLDITELLLLETPETVTEEVSKATRLFNDIQFMGSSDFNDLTQALIDEHIRLICERFQIIDKNFTPNTIQQAEGNNLYEKFYWLFTVKYNDSNLYKPSVVGYDIAAVNSILNFPNLLAKLSSAVFNQKENNLSFLPLTGEELSQEEQVWVRTSDNDLMITVPTKYGPCIEVVKALSEFNRDSDIFVLFGNGEIRGEISVNDLGDVFLENKEPSFYTVFNVLDTLGLFDAYCEKLGWSVVYAEEAGLLDRLDDEEEM